MTWVLKVECRDCGGGQDPLGCFDGGYETSEYPTEGAAQIAKQRIVDHGAPYDVEVYEKPAGSEGKPEEGRS